MALPANVDLVTVTGTYVYVEGTPATGKVTFTPSLSSWIQDAGAPATLLPRTITATLDIAGKISVPLPATDDPDLAPNGWTYDVVEDFGSGLTRKYAIGVPTSAGTIDLATVAPVTPVTGGSKVVTRVNGKVPDINGAVVLTPSDIGALPSTYTPPAAPVQSVSGKTGDVTLTASDVGALPVDYPVVQSVNGKTGGSVSLGPAEIGALDQVTADGRYQTPAAADARYTPKTTRRSTHTFCAAGDDGTTSAGKWNARYATRLPVTPTRFRLRIANYDVRDAGTDVAVATPLASVWIGAHALGPLGELTGKMSGAPVNLGITGTIPADGSYLTSAWITDPGALALLASGQHAVLSLGVNADGTARTAVRGWNRSWISFSSDNAGVLAPGDLGQFNYCLFDAQIEYEYVAPGASNPVVLCVGDSLTSGYQFIGSSTGPSIWSYPAQLGQRTGVAPINLGMFGSTTGLWVNPNGAFWTRADIAAYVPDTSIIHLGSNNAAASNALSAYQSDMVAIVGNVRAFSSVKRVFACTVPPRNFSTGTIPTGGDVAIGVNSIPSSISIASGLITIDSGANAETATVTAVSGTGPYTLTLSAATTKAHAAGAVILGTSETCRTQYNTWLRSMPLGLSGVVDLDLLLRDPANVRILRAEYDCGDGIHLTPLGYGEVAGAVTRAVAVA